MRSFDLTKYSLYRWRYWIGYGLLSLLFVGMLYIAAFHIPGSISIREESSLISASQVTQELSLTNVPTNAPFYLLQHATLTFFGPSLLGIKLPALILGLITAILLVLLLRKWFTPGVAVLASFIGITTSQFLLLAQQGNTSILYVFWPTLLLFIATMIARRARFGLFWKIAFFISAALSLYTPLSIYVLIIMGSTILLHPHLRYIMRRLSRLRVLYGMIAGAVIVAPLVISCVLHPSQALSLLGVPTSAPDFWANAQQLALQYFDFMHFGNSVVIMPVFGLASFLLIIYGLYRLLRSLDTVQSYIIFSWTTILLPVLLINPNYTSIMFVPLLLLLATGLNGLFRTWYRLFPKNPYARVVGWIPLAILVGSMVFFGIDRYSYGYRYTPEILQNYSTDLILLPNDTSTLVVADDEKELFDAVASYRNGLTVTTTIPTTGTFVTTPSARPNYQPVRIIVNDRQDDAARFFLYNRG